MINYVWFYVLVVLFAFAGQAGGAENVQTYWPRKLVFGWLIHDRGPASDRHESGFDPNWELQFDPPELTLWQWIRSPLPTIGVTPNFSGHTSVVYAGITYELSLSNKYTDGLTDNMTRRLFIAGGLSAALHNGPLHKEKTGCERRSDCGFGYRVLPRLNLEIGGNFWGRHGVALFYDHMSHKGVLPGENEGIDHIGVRYHFSVKQPNL